MIHQISKVEYRIPSMKFSALSDSDKFQIENFRSRYILSDFGNLTELLFPGFVFSHPMAAVGFDKFIFSPYEEMKITNTPRGNLSKKSDTFIFGIQPGHNFDYNFNERLSCAWDFGPSTKMLMKLLSSTNVYPYFSNVYHTSEIANTKNISYTYREITCIIRMHRQLYKTNHTLKFIFLGNYEEYYRIVNQYKSEWRKYPNIVFARIFHPSYVSRFFDEAKYNDWTDQFLNLRNVMFGTRD